MDKLLNYNGSIDLISGLRPKNNGTFPLMQAHDVQVTETKRLDDMFTEPESWLPVYNGESEGGTQGGTGGSTGGGGVPQYNLSTVVKLGEDVTLDATDSVALASIMSNINDLLKFQNVGAIVYQEEAEGHQAFVGLDIKTDFVVNKKIVFSYQGLFYDLDIIANLATAVITAKLMSKSQTRARITRTKVTLAQLQGMLNEEHNLAKVLLYIKPSVAKVDLQLYLAALMSQMVVMEGRIFGGIKSTNNLDEIEYLASGFVSVNAANNNSSGTLFTISADKVSMLSGNTSSEEFSDVSHLLNDEYFDFYIYD